MILIGLLLVALSLVGGQKIQPGMPGIAANRMILRPDSSDTIYWSFSKLYSSVNLQHPQDLQLLWTGPEPDFKVLSQQHLPVARMVTKIINSTQGTNSEWILEISEFQRVPIGEDVEVCLFVWMSKSPQVELTTKGCLNVNLRVVNNSLDFTDIASKVYSWNLELIAAEKTPSICFESFTQDFLPNYFDYNITDCTVADHEVSTQVPPKILSRESKFIKSNSAISSREIDLISWEGFSGSQQVYLDGYIIDYDLEEGQFRVYGGTKHFQYISAVNLDQKCLKASFFRQFPHSKPTL